MATQGKVRIRHAGRSQDRFETQLFHASCLAGGPAEGQVPSVNLSHYLAMDPHLLLGLLNTELRNHCDSLDDLVKTHHLDEERLVEKMAAADYVYYPELNQFR